MYLRVYGILIPTTSNGNMIYCDENGDEQQIHGEFMRDHYINPNTIPEGKHICYIERQVDVSNVKLTAWERGLDGNSDAFRGSFISDVPVPHKARVKKIYDNRIVFELEGPIEIKGTATSDGSAVWKTFTPIANFPTKEWGFVEVSIPDDF